MRNLRARLPPVNSLVVFEAAARHLSFTRAGEELRVSREAVSRQIRTLESLYHKRLFVRLHRALELTDAGRQLQAAVSDGLERIARASDELLGGRAEEAVSVASTVAIASFWLTPLLPRFRSRHPETTIHVKVSDSPPEMRRDGIDVGLRYGDGNWTGLAATHLFDVASFPVCSPDYLQGAPALVEAADLPQHTLLNLEGPTHAPEDWNWWLRSFGIPSPKPQQVIGFDNYANVIQAALEGQGVALGFTRLMDDLLSRGQLVRPISAARSKGLAVYLVIPQDLSLATSARRFRDWLLREAGTVKGVEPSGRR